MERSKFDLCADNVRLDYNELVHVAGVALHYSRNAVEDGMRESHNNPTNTSAEYFSRDADNMARAERAYYYLTQGATRSYAGVTGHVSKPVEELPFNPQAHSYNKISLIKQLRTMLEDRGYGYDRVLPAEVERLNEEMGIPHKDKFVGLKDCKDIIEALMNIVKYYK